MSKKILAGLIGVLVLIAIYYNSLGFKKSIKMEKVTFGVERSILTSAIWVAENKGFFKREGLDLTIKEYQSGKLSFEAMLDKEKGIEISIVAPTPIMFNSFKRDDFKIFATIVSSFNDLKVIAKNGRGIKTGSDLKGKKIGTPFGTTGQFYIEEFLVYNKVESSDVELINISPDQLLNALKSNKVDAVVIWEPHAFKISEELRDQVFRISNSDIYNETFNLVARDDFIKSNPETLKKILRAINAATHFLINNTKEAQKIVRKRLNLTNSLVEGVWGDFNFQTSLDSSLLLTLEDEARWAIKNNLTKRKKIPNYLRFIYSKAMKEVGPNWININN